MDTFEMPRGTMATDGNGNVIDELIIRTGNASPVPDDGVSLSEAYIITPADAVFSEAVIISLTYDISSLPEKISSINLAYLSEGPEWKDLESLSDSVAEAGKVSFATNSSGTFAIFGRRLPASFKVNHMTVSPSSEKYWGPVAFAVRNGRNAAITAEIVNEGGQAGIYTGVLKLNGAEISQKDRSLESNQSSVVSFRLSGISPGKYSVEIGGVTAEFDSSFWINWWLITGMIVAFAVFVWLIRRSIIRKSL